MSNTTNVDLHPVLARQLDCMERRDLDGLMDNYVPDAMLVRFDGASSGLPEIRAALGGYLELKPKLVEIQGYAQSGDVIMYKAIMKLNGQPEESVGTMVVRDGKIWRQTAAFDVG